MELALTANCMLKQKTINKTEGPLSRFPSYFNIVCMCAFVPVYVKYIYKGKTVCEIIQ